MTKLLNDTGESRLRALVLEKVGHMWSAELADKITQQIASYKKDVGIKNRKGIMRQYKSPYNLTITLQLQSSQCMEVKG